MACKKTLGSWFVEALTTEGATIPTEAELLEYLLTGKPPALTINVDAEITATTNNPARPTTATPFSEANKIEGATTAPERKEFNVMISQNTIDAVKQLEPETLAARGVITKSNSSGYNCIDCGNGSGDDGTGVIPKLEADGWHYICHCGASHDNIHLLARHYGLDSKRDFSAIVERACDDFGIALEYDGDAATGNSKSTAGTSGSTGNAAADEARKRRELQERQKEEEKARELPLIHADIEKARLNLPNLPEAARRGLTLETLEHFGCGFIANWISPKLTVDGKDKFATPTPRFIVPTANHYLARLIVPAENYPEGKRKYIHSKEHAGGKELFNGGAIDDIIDGKLIYRLIVVEGEIDAMSIWQAFEGKTIGVVALGGAQSYGLLVDALEARLDDGGGIKIKGDNSGKELEVVVLFDDDGGGHKSASELLKELSRLNIPAAESYFPADGDTKVDANQILQDKGGVELFNAVMGILGGDDTEAALDAAKADIATRRRQEAARQATREILATGSGDSGNGDEFTDDLRDFVFKQVTGSSDLDNARRFVKVEDNKLKFLADGDRWLLYEKGLWKLTPSGKNYPLMPLVIDTADKLATAASDKAETKIAAPFRNQRNISGMLSYVKGLVKVTRADLDKHPQLLNVKNGVIDLQTGELYAHAPELLLTQQINAIYNPAAESEIVSKFLRDIQPDADDQLALQVFFGYAFTGEVNVENFLFLQGGGGNGKGTLTGTILDLAGDYGTAFPIRGILKSKNTDANAATTALNTLICKRLGIGDEIPKSAKVDLGTLKHLTGGDNVPMRRNYEEYGNIAPTWKLIFSGNDPLLIEDIDDEGFLRRFRYLPFTQSFTGSNANSRLKQQLKSDECRSALLKWIVDGARWYYDHNCGIYISARMEKAAAAYVAAQDWLGDFIREHCEPADDCYIPLADFIAKLKDNCAEATRYGKPTLQEMIKRKIAKLDGVHYERTRDTGNKHSSAKIFGLRWIEN